MSNLHALLIGINHYLPNLLPNGLFYKDLLGCVADALIVEEFLLKRLGVPPKNIIKLTSTSNQEKVVEPPSQRPTYKNIVKAFRQITEKAQPGDQVFIHYSGHGGRTTTTKAFRHLKRLDEVLVPMDLGNSERRYLRDTEIHFLVQAMVDRGLMVTLALDSCHTGGVTRGEQLVKQAVNRTGVRGIDVIDTTPCNSNSLVASEAELLRAWQLRSQGVKRNAEVGSGWLLNPEGYVLLAACRANEQANEFPFDGKQTQGALTYWMVQALKELESSSTYRMLHESILARVHGQFKDQTPQLEGEANREVFGSNEGPGLCGVNVLRIEPDKTLTINAGLAHGVRRGSRFNIFALNETRLTHINRRIAEVEVTETGAVESRARILNQKKAQSLQPGCQAVLQDTGSMRLRRRVSLTTAEGADWGSQYRVARKAVAYEIARRRDGFIALAANEETPDFFVTVNERGEYVICNSGGVELTNLRPALTVAEQNTPALVERLVHLARYNNVFELANHQPHSPLSRKLKVELVGTQPEYDEDEKPAPRPFGRNPAIVHGEWAFLRIRNDHTQPLNITVLDMQTNWAISQIYPSGGADFELLEPKQEIMLPLHMTLPDGYESGVDTIKVFATVETTSFRWLQLPVLDQPEIVNNVRGLPVSELEKFLLMFSPVGARTRLATVTVSGGNSWTVQQVELKVRRKKASSARRPAISPSHKKVETRARY